MKASVSGGCSCGAVRYFSRALTEQVSVCHCRDCQGTSGSAFAVRAGLYSRDLEVQGAEAIAMHVKPGASGRATRRSFCSRCGSQIFISFDAIPDLIFVQAGTLDDSSWVNPNIHLWCGEKQPWVAVPADALAT
ncbi:hypothetical protein DFR24_3512 [Panacagrimonas perspica]|uniref:CENP-V/GFA domain-containing protein n=1 Tax=Panacagrimonas perspica TaxID=381431 RepID=A0A4S3K2B0_9GAMM|nr:GFA family protein [Panacagrimonas perspica]TDU26486.1 hypothetical protein DFR24_3512 [Panacagrimonas perspica]THD02102.1 hypothetical protein B1810_16630 [Panacagrimonas perspica]